MTTMTSARVEAGTPNGGQFTTTGRDEADVDLPAAHERREVLSGLADDLFYAEHPPTSAELNAAKIEAREVLGDLGDAEFEHRWSRVIDAARNHAAFADEKRGFELVSAGALTEDDSCGVELEDFTEINAAVAPGLPGHLGYDLRGYADAIATAWGMARYIRVVDAVDADDLAAATG